MRELIAHDELEGKILCEDAELTKDALLADEDGAWEAAGALHELKEVARDIFDHLLERQIFIDHRHGIEEAFAGGGVHDEERINVPRF